ncbi:MAG: hypothetical protein AB7O97_13820 [Planctomycetota bacterium]
MRTHLLPLLLLLALPFPACKAPDLLYEPKPDDPLDGYQGHLAEAGVNTAMDWGPKQEYLLSGYKALREEHATLQKRFDELLSENQNLKLRLNGEGDALQKERTLRAQAEAELQTQQQKRRELEAQLLSLGIEKQKLEQTALLARIADLQRSLEEFAPPADAAAPPGAPR